MEENYKSIKYNDSIEVFYTDVIDGGGMKFGQDYVPFIKENFGKVGRVYEWCSGPAFIGFSILAHGLCDSLCLADINPVAVEACKKTIKENGLEDKVSLYLSDCFDDIPETEKWDLVVSNPPHANTTDVIEGYGEPIIYQDVGWNIHKKFYDGVKAHLNPGGIVLIQENGVVSKLEDFTQMIEDGGLKLVKSMPLECDERKYYVWCE